MEHVIEIQLQREVIHGRVVKDPTLDGLVNTQRVEALIRAGILTASNAPQIVPPPDMPRITSTEYHYFDKRIIADVNFNEEMQRWRRKFDGDGGSAMIAKGTSRATEGCAWECMLVETTKLLCFRYYTKRSGNLGRQIVRQVYDRQTGRLRWANCKLCKGGECRPWCSHITMGFPYLTDIQKGRAVSGACTDGRRPWGPNTREVDAR